MKGGQIRGHLFLLVNAVLAVLCKPANALHSSSKKCTVEGRLVGTWGGVCLIVREQIGGKVRGIRKEEEGREDFHTSAAEVTPL